MNFVMKTTLKYCLVVSVLLTTFTLSMKGQTYASVSSQSKARIINIIQLTKIDDLNFGRIFNGATGTVMLTTSGSRSTIGVIPIGDSGWSPAKFEVRGAFDYEYYIGLPSDITVRNGSNELLIEDLVAKPSTSVEDGLIGVVKSDSYFTVGGKLVIESTSLPTGHYSSDFEVSVGYN